MDACAREAGIQQVHAYAERLAALKKPRSIREVTRGGSNWLRKSWAIARWPWDMLLVDEIHRVRWTQLFGQVAAQGRLRRLKRGM